MKTYLTSQWLLLAMLLSVGYTGAAQQLLWEKAVRHTPATSNNSGEALSPLSAVTNVRFTVQGAHGQPQGSNCTPRWNYYYQTYNLNGTLLREQMGRGGALSELGQEPAAALGSGTWWQGFGRFCVGNAQHSRAFVQRLSAAGDTIKGFWLSPAALPRTSATALLAQGNKLVVAGWVQPLANQAQQVRQYQLTCLDTLGNIRWQKAYAHPPLASDYSNSLAATPRGGYLISGDGLVGAGQQHYLIETDSMGNLRRQRLMTPLGPQFYDGVRYSTNCNLIALPNAGGYLLSGSSDSARNNENNAYLVRLDTALNVTWVYRHPPRLGTSGPLNAGQYAYKLHLLPGNTAGLLVQDLRGSGLPDAQLVHLDLATGQRLGMYTLSSNTQQAVVLYDWQWLGDGTLLAAGKSWQLGVTGQQGYLARWDLRGTPLAQPSATRPGAAAGLALWAYPNPAHEQVTLRLGEGTGRGAALLTLHDAAGRPVRGQAVAAGAGAAVLAVAGLPPGLYLARWQDADGLVLGTAKVVVER